MKIFKKTIFTLLLLAVSTFTFAQEDVEINVKTSPEKQNRTNTDRNDFYLHAGIDVASTAGSTFGDQIGFGIEAGYFLVNRLALNIGVERTVRDLPENGISFSENGVTLGARFYPVKNAFIRYKTINFQESVFGFGYGVPMGNVFSFEPIVDYYAVSEYFGFRAAITARF